MKLVSAADMIGRFAALIAEKEKDGWFDPITPGEVGAEERAVQQLRGMGDLIVICRKSRGYSEKHAGVMLRVANKASETLGRFADLIASKEHEDKIARSDKGWRQLGLLVKAMRLYSVKHLGKDLMTGRMVGLVPREGLMNRNV